MPFAGAIGGVFVDTLHDGAGLRSKAGCSRRRSCYVAPDGKVTETDLAPKPPIDASSYTSEETFAPPPTG